MADLEIARTGLTETEARKAGLRVKSAMATGTDRPGICPNPHRITIKLVYEANTRQVLGAQAWGEKNVSARINAIAVAIRGSTGSGGFRLFLLVLFHLGPGADRLRSGTVSGG